jgi:hypothetical protein
VQPHLISGSAVWYTRDYDDSATYVPQATSAVCFQGNTALFNNSNSTSAAIQAQQSMYDAFYACNAGEERANGRYTWKGTTADGTPFFVNGNGWTLKRILKFSVDSMWPAWEFVSSQSSVMYASNDYTNATASAPPLTGGFKPNPGQGAATPAPMIYHHICPAAPSSDPASKYEQWYLSQINVSGVWKMGINGSGVRIRINDVGVDYSHVDLKDKFSMEYSFGDPMPPLRQDSNSVFVPDGGTDHGTHCAGFAVASANSNCGIGVAFGATFSAAITVPTVQVPVCQGTAYSQSGCDQALADLLASSMANNHISSNSWARDGCVFRKHGVPIAIVLGVNATNHCPFLAPTPELPYSMTLSPCISPACTNWESAVLSSGCRDAIVIYCADSILAENDPGCAQYRDLFAICSYGQRPAVVIDALANSTEHGRGGKGTIFVFASGNEANIGEDVNAYWGMASSMYTIAVGATAGDGKIASYSSRGSAVLVSAPGGDFDMSYEMWTVGPMQSCVDAGRGTSYATPVVSGVIALMLQANPDLNWRDVQDILTRTSTKLHPEDPSWTTNSGGLSHSYKYGFGRIDAYSAVVASTQQVSSTQAKCTLVSQERLPIPDSRL